MERKNETRSIERSAVNETERNAINWTKRNQMNETRSGKRKQNAVGETKRIVWFCWRGCTVVERWIIKKEAYAAALPFYSVKSKYCIQLARDASFGIIRDMRIFNTYRGLTFFFAILVPVFCSAFVVLNFYGIVPLDSRAADFSPCRVEKCQILVDFNWASFSGWKARLCKDLPSQQESWHFCTGAAEVVWTCPWSFFFFFFLFLFNHKYSHLDYGFSAVPPRRSGSMVTLGRQRMCTEHAPESHRHRLFLKNNNN